MSSLLQSCSIFRENGSSGSQELKQQEQSAGEKRGVESLFGRPLVVLEEKVTRGCDERKPPFFLHIFYSEG